MAISHKEVIVINTELIQNFIAENKLSKAEFCRMSKISSGTLRNIFAQKNVDLICYLKSRG